MKWIKRGSANNKLIAYMVKKYKITSLQAELLINRGITEDEHIKKYLYGCYTDIYSPDSLKDIEKAIVLIAEIIEKDGKICVFGDYDADGITATAIMIRCLSNLGVKVTYYLPSRIKEGYGMNIEAIKKIAKRNVDLIITVDNGIASKTEVEYAQQRGMKVIVTDHHNIQEDKIPTSADAIVNPKQSDCTHPNKDLCGAAIAWKVMYALYFYLKKDMDFVKKHIALAAIATVADMMPLTDENRIIVKEGLIQANQGAIYGLTNLMEACNIEELTSEDIGFRIGPCLNADGRLEDAHTAITLLTASSNGEELAQKLVLTNNQRKQITVESYARAMDYIAKNGLEKRKFLVVYDETIPEGLVGLVASRIKEKFNVPTLVFTKGEDCFKASGRGVEGYPINMFDALMETKDYWIKGGGHAMACGVSIEPSMDKLVAFSNRLNELAITALEEKGFAPFIEYDKEIETPTEEVCQEILILEPTGKENPKATFVSNALEVQTATPIGDGSHIKLAFANGLQGISFGGTNKFQDINSLKVKVLYTPIIEIWSFVSWSGEKIKKRSMKLMIEDFQGANIQSRNLLISSLGRHKRA